MLRCNCWVAICKGPPASFLGSSLPPAPSWSGVRSFADPAHRTIGRTVRRSVRSMLLISCAMTLAYLGYIDQARSRMDEALSEARRLGHVHTLAHVLHFANWLDWLTRSPMVHTGGISGSDDRAWFSVLFWVGHWHSADDR